MGAILGSCDFGRHMQDNRTGLGIGLKPTHALADQFKRRLAGALQVASCIRQFDAPPHPVKQRLAQMRLKRANLVTDRRLRDVQFIRRRGEPTQPRGGLEPDERSEGRKEAVGITHEVFLLISIELPV